jgi:hypothetical protein
LRQVTVGGSTAPEALVKALAEIGFPATVVTAA